MLSIPLTAIGKAAAVTVTALWIGNICSIEAFSNHPWRPVSVSTNTKHDESGLSGYQPLFAKDQFQSDDENDEKDQDEDLVEFSCDMNTDPPILDWDLQSLLSSDPSTESRLIPLMQVYDAAASAAKETAESYDSHNDTTSSTTPSRAPSILPSVSGPLKSFGYEGELAPSIAPYRMFVREYSRDMGHNGRFTVFGEDGRNEKDKSPTLQSDVVFSMDDPLSFIRDNLSYAANPNKRADETVVYIPGPYTTHEQTADSRYMEDLVENDHAVTRPSPERLKYLSQVLDGLPMAQIHAGTHIDQGNLDIELTCDTMNNLLSFGLLSKKCQNDLSSFRSMTEGSTLPPTARYRLRARDLDLIHTVLSRAGPLALSRPLGDEYLGSDSKGLKDTLIRLIDIAVRSVREDDNNIDDDDNNSNSNNDDKLSPPHLVLMTYSTTSDVLVAALSEWKKRVTTPMEEPVSDNDAFCRDGVGVGMDEHGGGDNLQRQLFSEQEAELLLHKALTVVTISATSQGFVDGPAYIHVSMNDDPLASNLGVTKTNPNGGGKDAVIMQALSPYLIDDEDEDETETFIYKNDAHNIDSCVIQYLALVRRINGVTSSFREMYNLGIADADSKKLDISSSLFAVDYRSVGQLIIPPRIDCELIPAMIRATGGERWLWNPSFQLGEGGVEGFYSPLPSLEYAQAELENQLGYNSYDEIVENCCRRE